MADWFESKRYGLGAGLPIAWQGWVVTLAYVAAVIGTAFVFAQKPLIVLSIVLPLTALFLLLTARTTRGGWRWRWGEKE
ncbi:MAG TPA: hypothetical protein VJ763_05760 [Sphingomicrobium sp.]|nr:hypothetical protein [Sphingomicrobium sp.]